MRTSFGHGGTTYVRRKGRNKYRNIKTEIDGITFDSRKEAEYYSDLKMQEKAGLISELELQPHFLLQDKFRYEGKTMRKIEYIADFKYIDEEGVTTVVDVKGQKTDVYKLKKKLFLAKYGENIHFVEI